ncbi:MAG: glycosyltransferase, partial [Deltaproteobacteria bacterium]|nr:glycosyltransferase [Deltaproteobacteria bacterium]
AYNCRDTIARCLESLSGLDHPSYEVIVVDDGSTDGTAAICESFEGARVMRLDNGGPSRARNAGLEAARASLVAFTDSDCVVDKGWLKELEKGFTGPDVAGVGGDQKSPDDETELGQGIQEMFKMLGIVTYYMKTDTITAETEHNPSCNAAYRKAVLEEVGGFDETLWPGEDVDLDLRIRRQGYKLVYNPAALVGHYRPRTYRGFARMMRRYGASAWHLFKRYGFFRILHYEPLAAVLGLAFLAAMLVWEPMLWLLLPLTWPILFLWFFVKTRECHKGLQLTILFLIILIAWNWGFCTGYRWRPKV